MTTTQTDHNKRREILWKYLQRWMSSQIQEETSPSPDTNEWTQASEDLLRAAEVITGDSARGFKPEGPSGSTEQVPASSPEPSTPTVQALSSSAALEPPREGRKMSRMMKIGVIVGFILATLFGYWFATEGYTIQSPIKEFNIEFQSPIVAPDSSNPEVGSENSEPDFGDAADPDEYSPPTGSGSIWVCEGPLGETEEGLPAYEHCVDPPA